MTVTQEQIRAGRALLRLDQSDLARRARLSLVTIRRIEAADGAPRVAAATLEAVRKVLEDAGVEFIQHGVRRRVSTGDKTALLRDLKAISERSAKRRSGQDAMTKTDLYDEDGLPA